MKRVNKLSDYLVSPHMAEYGAFFGSEAGQALIRVLEPMVRAAPPAYPLAPGQADYIVGYANGAAFVLGIVGSLRELQSKLTTSGKEPVASYDVSKVLKEEYGYDDGSDRSGPRS